MEQIKILVINKRKLKRNFLIVISSIISVYLLISLYFLSHFSLHTEINGVSVSLKPHKEVSDFISSSIRGYKLQLLERNGETEIISAQDIDLQYNKNINLVQIKHLQNPILWLGTLFKNNVYYLNNLYTYDAGLLNDKINSLKCLNGTKKSPQNVSFNYSQGSYHIIREQYGYTINKDRFVKAIQLYIDKGKTSLDLNTMNCYENPTYTVNSKKTFQTKKLLDKYVSAKIIYQFGNSTEELDGTTINQWLKVDKNLDVTIDKESVAKYIDALSKKYNTVGINREFQSSIGKKIVIKGGIYGWKINREAEIEALYNHIKQGKKIEKEPVYLQKASTREGNEIGKTYIEINITRQFLWFYKDGKLIASGPVVTGNPNRNNATVLGAYMINYKQKGATLRGPDYAAKVTYWMPFFGNIGVHDASWRYRFGGDIYKRNGTHGCVNASLYMAKTIFENIEEGTPVILYEEDN